ncbi:sensor histidine kinase [Pedobacter jamesrossensis]|uniref:Sensor histidine kinase n=1 Tax=Pedobacter jamesrossensis TaxID=1908238 RepID=A0ABV8NQ46_9SPHI
MRKNKYRIIIYHTLFWSCYMLLANLLEYGLNPKNHHFSIGDIFFTQAPNIVTVYLCVLLCHKYANPPKTLFLVVGCIVIFSFSYLNWYITSYYIRPYINANGPAPRVFNFFHFGISVLWIFVTYALIGFGYYYASESVKHERKLRLIEKEKHEAEYAFLRAQINPHFLNNTLNFFFAKSLPISEELANGIMTLSEIMRYSLEIDKDDKMTLIEDEIEHIKNVIKINQLRFNNKLQIDFTISGDTEHIRLIPLILITIVENILKHGDCTDKLHPIKIALTINKTDNSIYLSTWNKKKNGPKELSSGIGLENIKKRLTNHYKKDFSLVIKDTDIDYTLILNIPYNLIVEHKENIHFPDQITIFDQFKLTSVNPKPYTS